MQLDAEEIRVLGALVEKELTTPQQYPLTLNALVLACNQTSNRDPVVDYDETTVRDAVTRAKERGLARFVHPSHGRSVLRFRHELAEHLGLQQAQLALLAVLMLRGPQTPGELRARTERMADLAVGEVEAELEALARRDEPLVARLDRRPGQKEDRFVQLLGAQAPVTPEAAAAAPTSAPAPAESRDGLKAELAELRQELSALRRDLDELRAALGA